MPPDLRSTHTRVRCMPKHHSACHLAPLAFSTPHPLVMALSLHSSKKWTAFKFAAFNRASKMMRLGHIPPTLVSYLTAGKSARAILDNVDAPDENDFCAFEVEEILFKVHMSLFRLEIWWSPADAYGHAPPPDDNIASPVFLSETAENFRYFLWDLQAFPHELSNLQSGGADVAVVVDRALRIAEMARKHNFSPLETYALESLRQFVLSPYFHSSSTTQHCRSLSVATSSPLGHDLLRDLSRRLIHRILRRKLSLDPALVSFVEADSDPRLREIRGAVYYRQLVDMERHLEGRAATQPVFPAAMDVERRMRFLAAHISLSALAAQLHASAPPIPAGGCRAHSRCLLAWESVWASVAVASGAGALGSADVLGRLHAMMVPLKRMVSETPTLSIDCGLASLEAVVARRDDIIDGLMEYFL
ncbi:hypothetical protein DFH07DRAFT_965426 [Mycena maculata]|uniref:BTB/POZ domain-containing protein n=1 Tax=Mycena maculata TaxID=230809 RepID=A0AAD7ID11_9AGAR|nr:hypothetical protein DFH07DRAFT_965426 [Mycena maculata]